MKSLEQIALDNGAFRTYSVEDEIQGSLIAFKTEGALEATCKEYHQMMLDEARAESKNGYLQELRDFWLEV